VYSDVFDGALPAIRISTVTSQPLTKTVAPGDIYTVLSLDYQVHPATTQTTAGDMSVIGVWTEGKAVLSAGRRIRSYVRYGAGLVYIPEVLTSTGVLYGNTLTVGVRGGAGIETAGESFQIFADALVQVTGEPNSADYGRAEGLISVPVTVGVRLGF
jgi:hypothetical protein